MGRKKFIFISIIILFNIQTSACSAEGQEGQGIWHNEYESEIEISSTEEECKDVSENENITFRVLDGKEISYQQLKSLSPDDLLHDVWEILPESTNLESKFGSKAKKGIWVLASKKNPSYLEEFEKKLAEN